MSESISSKFEHRAEGHTIHGLYRMLEVEDGEVISVERLIEVEDAAKEMLHEAYQEHEEILVMARGGTQSKNLFVWSHSHQRFRVVETDEMVYGNLSSIKCEFGANPKSGRHLFAYFKSTNELGERSRYVLNIGDEEVARPRSNRLYQVAEPSLDGEYAGSYFDVLQDARWQGFAAMTLDWFEEYGGHLDGKSWLSRVEQEVIQRGFSLDEYVTGLNLCLNPGTRDSLFLEATLLGVAQPLNPQRIAMRSLVPVYRSGEIYPVRAVDFAIGEEKEGMSGFIYGQNSETGVAERIALHDNQVALRVRQV